MKQKFKEISEVFLFHAGKITIDKKLYDKLKKFRMEWMYRSESHINFMSSNLIGVYKIRFTKSDEEEIYAMFDIDYKSLRDDLYELPDIYKERHVSSNPRYLLLLYIAHLIHISNIKTANKNKILLEVYYILAIEIFSSLMVNYYKFELDEDIAIAVFESLSNRFILKKVGSWQKLFEEKAEDIYAPRSVHSKRLTRFKTVDATYTIADLQGKLRSIVKELTRVVNVVIETNTSRDTRSILTTNAEGDESVLDVIHANNLYHTSIQSIIFKRSEFINEEYVQIMKELYSNLHEKELLITLEYISNNYINNKREIDELVETAINANISYLYLSKLYPPYDKSIIAIVKFLRGYWINSKVKDVNNKKFKKLAYKFTVKATGKKTDRIIVTVVIALAIYLMLIAIKKTK